MIPSPAQSILVLFKQFGLTLALGLFLLGSAAAANLHPVRGFLRHSHRRGMRTVEHRYRTSIPRECR